MEQEQLDIVKERIRAFMREDAYRPLKEDELAAGLRGVGEDVPGFAEALAALEADGAVIRNRSGLYGVPHEPRRRAALHVAEGVRVHHPRRTRYGGRDGRVRARQRSCDRDARRPRRGARHAVRAAGARERGRDHPYPRACEYADCRHVRAQQGVRIRHARQREDRARRICPEKGF